MCFRSFGMRLLHLGIGALLAAAQLGAATLSRLSLDDMINQSTSIVRVKVSSPSAALRGSTIYTTWQIQALDIYKGQAPATVATPGGTANGYRQSFPGSPQLFADKEYVLFLWTSPSGLTQVIGLTQGLFEVTRDANGAATATRGASTDTMLDPATGQVVKDQSIQMQVGDLSSTISSTLAKGKSN